MSDAVRQEIAVAASTVEGVHCFPRYQQVSTPGEAVVKLGRLTRPSNGFGQLYTWQVWLVLPQELDEAEEWLDEHLVELWDALAERMVVQSATPTGMSIGGATLNGVVVEGVRGDI